MEFDKWGKNYFGKTGSCILAESPEIIEFDKLILKRQKN